MQARYNRNQEGIRMKSNTRIVMAFVISFTLTVVLACVNGQTLLAALQSAFGFAILTTFLVTMLSWGIELAERKGFPGWAGFLLVLIFNVFGLLILIILPARTALHNDLIPK
jgi:hypothetical protein